MPAHVIHDQLSTRLRALQPSVTLVISQLARKLTAEGRDIINMSSGELDFDTHEPIVRSAIAALHDGQTRYTDVGGTPALKAAIIAKFKRENQLTFTPRQIIASTGAKQIIFNALLATLEPEDEVTIPAPYWVSYPEMVRLTGAVPRYVEPGDQDDFKLTPARLEAALNANSRWLLINSPGNPSGALYNAQELRALGEVLATYPRVLVMSDDIYEHIVYEGAFVSFATAVPSLAARTLTVNGVSKAYAMTGWRLGYAGGPEWLIDGLSLLQSQSTSCPSAIGQAGALAALNGPQALLPEWCGRLRQRRDVALSLLRQAPELKVATPPAAFYLFVDCRDLIGKRSRQAKQCMMTWRWPPIC